MNRNIAAAPMTAAAYPCSLDLPVVVVALSKKKDFLCTRNLLNQFLKSAEETVLVKHHGRQVTIWNASEESAKNVVVLFT